MNIFQKTATAAAVTLAGFAGAAEARCVTGVGEDFTASVINDITLRAHRQRVEVRNWDPDNKKPFGKNGPLDKVTVGKFSFGAAVDKCEEQHKKAMAANPGQPVTTGLTCDGRRAYVITNNQSGLVCRR
jgi:hypothetical protein